MNPGRSTDDFFRQMVEMMPALAWSSRPDGAAEFFNQGWLDYTGLRVEDALEWGWTAAVHPDDVDALMAYWQSVLAAGEPAQIEGRLRRFDGDYRWFLFRAKPLRDEAGGVKKWFGTNTDIDDRKRTEDALAESERQLRLMVDTIPAFVCMMNAQGELETVNRQVTEYMGKTSEELRDWAFIGTVHEDDLTRVVARWRLSIESGEPYEIEHRIRRADGVFRWFHVRGLPLRDDQNRVRRWYVLLTDIEDRQRAEEARIRAERDIQESEQNLREIVETLPAVVWQASADGAIEFANRRLDDFTGKMFHEVAGDRWVDTLHPDDVAGVVEAWKHACATGSPYDITFRVRRADGEYRWVQVVAEAVRDAEGSIRKWYGLMLDAHERKRAIDALRESERELRQLADSIPGMIAVANGSGMHEYANRRAMEYVGMSLAEVADLGWINTIHPDEQETVGSEWMRCVTSGVPMDIDHRWRRHDGVYRWFHARVDPLFDEQGHVVRWYGLLTDIDDSKRIAEDLLQAQARLAGAAQLATVAELSASIAHEINQPLASVVANGHACQTWLSNDPPNLERARLTAERVIRDAHSAAEVVKRVRGLFKHAAPDKTRSDINEIAREVLRLIREEVRDNNIIVETNLEEGLPTVMADRVQIQQVLVNLLHNAVEAMEGVTDRRVLSLSSSRRGSELVIQVRDQGCGLVNSTSVFDPFFTTKATGMGMGLSIARSIIDAHGGNLSAVPNDGRGTTFLFTLPLAGAV